MARNELGKRSAPETKADPGEKKTSPKLPEPLKPLPEAFVVQPTGTGNWRKATLAPMVLAARVDKAIREMNKTFGEAVSTIMTPHENGQVKNAIKVQDYKTYSVQTLHMAKEPSVLELRADGSKKAKTGANGAFERARPIGDKAAEAKLTGRQLVEQWPRAFPRLAFLSLTEGQDSWQPYVKELLSGKSGFKAEISERVTPFRGENWMNYRIVAKRTPEAAKRLGRCEVEIVLDGKRNLPVTIRVNQTDPNGGAWKVLWQTGWNFNHKFDPREFQLPD